MKKIVFFAVLFVIIISLASCQTPDYVTLTFDSTGGSEIQSIEISTSTEPESLPIPTKEHFSFDGWYIDEDYSIKAENHIFRRNQTVYAKWIPVEYTITYNNFPEFFDGAYNPNASSYNVLSEIVLLEPTRGGANFLGWYYDEDFELEALTTIPTGSSGDIELYIKWEYIEYTLTFDTLTDDVVVDITYTIDDETFTLPVPEKDGYVFMGWTIAGVAPIFEITQGYFYSNINFRAKWLERLNVEYVLFGGENHEDNPEYITVESSDITLQAPQRERYNFGGWYTSLEFNSEDYVTKIEEGRTEGITLYANWIYEHIQLFLYNNDSEYEIMHSGTIIENPFSEICIPNNKFGTPVTKIMYNGFGQREYLLKINVPEGIRILDRDAFASSQFTTLTMPSTLEYIGAGSFRSTNLQEITFLSTVPPEIVPYYNEYLGATIERIFLDNYVPNIYVPAESVDIYKNAPIWSDYADYIFAIQQGF